MLYRANPITVTALRIEKIEDALPSGQLGLHLEGNQFHIASPEELARMTPVAGDYVVTQEDGYVYLNPREVFERKYSPLDTYPPDTQRAQFHALFDAAENFNSDLTNITGRDVKDNILFVAVFARGEEAARVDKLLASQT